MKQNFDGKHSFENNQVVSETNTLQFYKSPSLYLGNQRGHQYDEILKPYCNMASSFVNQNII